MSARVPLNSLIVGDVITSDRHSKAFKRVTRRLAGEAVEVCDGSGWRSLIYNDSSNKVRVTLYSKLEVEELLIAARVAAARYTEALELF